MGKDNHINSFEKYLQNINDLKKNNQSKLLCAKEFS